MSGVRFTANADATRRLVADPAMGRALENVAAEMAAEMERSAPPRIQQWGATFGSRLANRSGEQTGEAFVRSAFWHWAEYGTAGYHFGSPQPFIRPSAQIVMSKYRGRWKATPK